jgi:glycosyltransferase involved in cell wall biosynthesis
MKRKYNLSVLILTKDEEANLPISLKSIEWCDDIVVLDSGSKDNTERISRDAGARFYERDFDNYANQRNYGLQEIEYKNKWVLMLDADEVVTAELLEEIDKEIGKADNKITLYRLRLKYYLFGRWIKRSSGYPFWVGRLVRIGRVKVEREINERFVTDGEVGLLQEHLLHYPFNKGFHAWLDKHNRYSTMEAELMFREGKKSIRWRNLFSSDPADRRVALKDLYYTLPGRPLIYFLFYCVFRGGFLEGRAGLTYGALRSIYEFMINCKLKELDRKNRNLPV